MAEIKGIKYTGPILDNSGYAKACRENILALYKLGVPLTLNPISFEQARPDLGKNGNIIRSLIGKSIDYNVNIIHTTPEFWGKFKEINKLNVGYTIWETTKLHPDWPKFINENVDGCMVGCEWNIEVFKNSGVTVPLFNVPHVVEVLDQNNIEPYIINGINPNAYKFYSIFQWQERKNPLATIKSYWSTFTKGENVALILKTYRSDYSDPEKDAIRNTIRRLKKVCPSTNYPPIYLILDMLSEEEMLGLHASGDCYVSLDRGEGFGLSGATAGATGKPIIVTGFGGAMEYAKIHNSYIVDFVEIPAFGMPWCPWYRIEQYWAEPSQRHGAELMRHVYENQEEAKQTGLKLQNYLKDNFNYEVIGNKIINALKSL